MTEYTAENLEGFKTVELRKLAKVFGITKLSRDGSEVSVNTGRKGELIPEILRQQEFKATFVSAEGRKNPNLHPVYGWPIAGEQPTEDAKAKDRKAVRTEKGVKGQLCAECGQHKIDRKTQGRDSTMCADCFEVAGLENEHADGLHDAAGQPAAGCPECERESAPAASEVSAKALKFEKIAREAGWSALARNAADGSGTSFVTAEKDGKKIEMHWLEGVYQYDLSGYVQPGHRSIKIRNASAARKLLADA